MATWLSGRGASACGSDGGFANRLFDCRCKQLFPSLGCSVEQRHGSARWDSAQTIALCEVIEFAPATSNQPAPEVCAQPRLHRHAQVCTADRGTDVRLVHEAAKFLALATRELRRSRCREELQPAHATSVHRCATVSVANM